MRVRSNAGMQDSIADQLHCQLRGKISGWAYLIIPLLFGCVCILLWVLMAFFGGELRAEPAPLIFSAAILTAAFLLGIATYQQFLAMTIRRHPLMQEVPIALEEISYAVITASNRKEIADIYQQHIQVILNPTFLDTALYYPHTNQYALINSNHSIPADDPLMTWLAAHPSNNIIHLPVNNLTAEAHNTQQMLVRWGIEYIVGWGKQGWAAIGKPHQKSTFDRTQLTALQYLSQSIGLGLERTALIETQKERAEELQAVYWITQAANFSVELDDLLE
ncbi:MAG: hypothetical protein P1S60_12630, partial [Anaerolineae bacterium]|nr:hypothetical protein [Anaerolineae bacterium]